MSDNNKMRHLVPVSTILAAWIAFGWAIIHAASIPSDSLGIRAVLMPLILLGGFLFFFCLVWSPVLTSAAIIAISVKRRPLAAMERNVLLVSVIPFVLCVVLFLKMPAMTRYHFWH